MSIGLEDVTEERMEGAPCPHRLRFLSTYFLWRLREPSHGYSLVEEMRKCPFMVSLKPSTIYAVLKAVENEKLVSSSQKTAGGWLLKVYATTEEGRMELERVRRLKMPPKLVEFTREMFLGKK